MCRANNHHHRNRRRNRRNLRSHHHRRHRFQYLHCHAAMVESLVDEEDDVEAEFSMMKTQMIANGTYYAKAPAY